ncbi:phosphoribosyltransferase [Amycolatopsis sacchari]|uniref:phosphoribosyltransferase n=1 Tax=Amycolatopsis sacchari TaxID=115433 RepID=UPI003EBA1B46
MTHTAIAPRQRVFEHRRVWQLSATTMERGCALIADAVSRHAGRPSAVIGIAHGGSNPARQIAARLDLTPGTVRARHNPSDDLYTPASGVVSCDLDSLRLGADGRLDGTVLLVDDICGTGATFDAVLRALRASAEPSTRFLTSALCRNRGAETPPNFYCWEVADWVVFPWEAAPGNRPTTPLPDPTEVIICV